jgi:hypothetical protein
MIQAGHRFSASVIINLKGQIGGLLLVATYLHWLFAKDANTMNKDKTSA